MKKSLLVLLTLLLIQTTYSQTSTLADSCKLNIGTNLGGIVDWGTEIPFVDLMKCSREWYTKSQGDPNYPWNSDFQDELDYRPDGYPTHSPQTIPESPYPQQPATIWGITDGWPIGQYTVLWDGDGTLSFFGGIQNLTQTNPNRLVFDYPNPIDGALEMVIATSNINDPVRNIRVLMPGTETTYMTDPFYQLWIDKVDIFETVRFMDWGQTNNWGSSEPGIGDGTLVDWSERSQPDFYTWTHDKGVPYEMMVAYMNLQDKDAWVCIPHTASEDYVRNMAQYFRDNLEPDRHIYVEYSNEIWNWMFDQCHWANQYGCEIPGVDWPEGTVPYIQNVMNYWTDEFAGQLHRTTRIVGIQTGWLDVAQRVAFNMDTASFDAVSPTYYFNFTEAFDADLDAMGASATAADIADFARQSLDENFQYISDIKTELADVIDKPIMFYEGGQHLTPYPFGVQPTYSQALYDIQRDTALYNIYNEWFDMIRTLQDDDEPLLLMNFAFVGHRSAQYGSWGILETMDQDFSVVPAPKYQALVENMNTSCMNPITELQLKVHLQGPFDSTTVLMNDNLRVNDEIPNTEPYTSLGFIQEYGGGEIMSSGLLTTTGNDAVVDWVLIELRDASNPSMIIATQAGLVQRDGDIISASGESTIRFDISLPSFYVAIRHRNHHGVRTSTIHTPNQLIAIDFTSPTTQVHGTNPMENIDGTMVLISGDANKDGQVNPVDKNDYWRLENGEPYNYMNSRADFNLDGAVNPVDKNAHWRVNVSKIEQLE